MSQPVDTAPEQQERLRRWRLILGSAAEPDVPAASSAAGGTGATALPLTGPDARLDAALGAVYDRGPTRSPTDRRDGHGRSRPARRGGGLGASAPGVARWLGDIRRFFPAPVVQVIQRDAVERLQLRRLLLEPELLAAVEPDVHLVATLLELARLLPDTSRATARRVVAQVVEQIEQRLAAPTRQSVGGSVRRAGRAARPRPADIDWDRTIRANLRHYRPELATVIPERLVGLGRQRSAIAKEVILAVDQSASMADSVVYAGVFGSVLASLRALRVRVVAFDTEIVDLTDLVADPVDLLFGVQLGGGTDIGAALAYCEGLVTRPDDTVLILLSDLFEGADRAAPARRLGELRRRGVTCIALLALSDEGAPAFDHDQAAALAAEGVPAFACTPDAFPELLAAAVEGRGRADWADWVGRHDLRLAHALGPGVG
jgi:Mg-chelatase subunit ChlD